MKVQMANEMENGKWSPFLRITVVYFGFSHSLVVEQVPGVWG